MPCQIDHRGMRQPVKFVVGHNRNARPRHVEADLLRAGLLVDPVKDFSRLAKKTQENGSAPREGGTGNGAGVQKETTNHGSFPVAPALHAMIQFKKLVMECILIWHQQTLYARYYVTVL